MVGQRAPVDIPAQVRQDLRRAWRGRFTVDDPPCGPDHLGPGQVGAFLAHQIEQQPATERREGRDGPHVGRAGGPPRGPVGGDAAGWHQTVHMGRIDEGPGPGVEDAADAQEPPDIMGGCGERDARVGRGAAQHVVQGLLVAADQLPQLLGQGQDDMTGGDWQACLPPLCQPHRGVMTVARGATPVAAGVVGIVLLTAVLPRPQVSAQGLGPAVDQISHRAALAGQESRAKPLLRGEPIAPEDVRHRWQARGPTRFEIGYEGVDGGVHDGDGVGRQMRVARGGPGALVPEECWDDAPRHAPLEEMGRLGVPERVHRGVFGEATLAYHELRGRLEGGRRERRLRGPSGEPPGPGARALPGSPPPLQSPCGQGHQAVFAPVALADADPQAQPTRIHHLQTHPGFRAWSPGQQGAHVLRTQHDGQLLAGPGMDECEDRPRALQRALGEKPDPIELDASRALGDLLLMEQGEDVLPEFLFAHVIGSPAVVLSQVCDGFERAVLGPGSQAPELEIFQHTASERRHRDPPVRGEHHGSKRSTRIRKINGRSA